MTTRRRELEGALREVSNMEADRIEGLRRSKSNFRLSEFTSSTVPPDPDIVQRKKSATKLSEFKRCKAEEKQHAARVRSMRLRQWQAKTRGAYIKALVRSCAVMVMGVHGH